MRLSKLIFLMMLLTACSRGVPDKSTAANIETATFVIDPVRATVNAVKTDATFSNLATVRSYDFTACIKSVANLDAVVGVQFSVRDGANNVAQSTSDASGCIHWSEPFQFSQASDETYFELNRTIEAMSVHKGKQALRLAVNPWKAGADSLLDLRFNSVPKLVKDGKKSAPAAAAFFVDSVAVQMELKRGANALPVSALRLSFSPKIKRTALDGQIVQEALGSGRVKVVGQLMVRTARSVIPLTGQIEFGEQQFSQGRVQIEANANFLHKAPRESMLELMISISPLDAPAGLEAVKGRVPLGQLTALTVNREAPLRADPSMVFFDAAQVAAVGPAQADYTFVPGQVTVEKVVVEELDTSGKPAQVRFQLQSCLFNSVSLDKILNLDFTVTMDGHAETVTADAERGCLRWQTSLPFSYFSKESFVRKEIEFSSANTFYGADSVKRVVHLNPWKFNDTRNAAVDEFYEGKPMAAAADQNSAAELVINDVSFQFTGRSFDVDARLNLSVIRKYKLVIRPNIKRMSRESGWLPAEGIGNGRFLVRVLLESGDPDRPRVIDSFTREVESQADLITIEDAAFRFNDLRLVSSRNQISVEVVPLHGGSDLVSRASRGWMDGGVMGFIRMNPRNTSIGEKVSSKSAAELTAGGADLLAKGMNFKKLDETALTALGLGARELSAATRGDPSSILRPFCDLFFESGFLSPRTFCHLRPSSYLSIAPTEHVAKMNSAVLAGAPDSFNFTMSAGISQSESETDSTSKNDGTGWKVDVGGKVGVPASGITGLEVGMGGGYEHFWGSTKSFTQTKATSRSHDAVLSKNILVDQVKFNVDIDVEKCFLVSSEFTKKREPRGYLACAPNAERRVVNESYYFMVQEARASALVDTEAAPDQKPLVFLVRGTERFRLFMKQLQNATLKMQLDKDPPVPMEILQESEGRYDGFFPGLLTPPAKK